ncbi:MAG: HAD-IC family P-type ATPase, partial [Actinomycetota bacterium]
MGPETGESRGHHGLSSHETLLVLGVHQDRGLEESEAAARLERYGPNMLPEASSGGALKRLLRQFHNPLVYVLLVAGAVTMLLGDVVDSSVIFGVVVINTVVGYIQESRAEAALDALRAMVSTQARVRREGRIRPIPSENIVPGDLVLVEAGDKVPADLRLLRHTELQVDESALTGESVPVAKD